MILIFELEDKNTEWPHISTICGKSIIIWSDTTIHVYSHLRNDVTNDHWRQSSGFHLILSILVFSGLSEMRYNPLLLLFCKCHSYSHVWSSTTYILMAFFSSVILLILISQYDMYLVLVFFSSLMKEMYGEMMFLKALLIKNHHLQVHILPL